MLEEGELMKQDPKGRGGDGFKMIDRGNEGVWGAGGLIEEINWYKMKPDVQKQMLSTLHFYVGLFSC